MTSPFTRLMAETARLTRNGDLQAATATIQTALQDALGAVAQATANATPAQGPQSKRTKASNDALVIDVQAREISEPQAPQAQQPPVHATQPIQARAQGEFIAGSHADHAAGSRDYKLFIPPNYDGQALPLVLMLHGCSQDPDDFAAGTGMNEQAAKLGFFVLYAAQSSQANPSRCWNWFKHTHQQRGRGEPALLAGLTREVMARYAIDPKRVFVAGLSAGGAMAAILGDAYPDLFAAVGVHSGLATGAATDLGAALSAMSQGGQPTEASGQTPPTIVFHGDQDNTVHPRNGEQVVAAATAGRAAQTHEERARSPRGRDYTRRIYRSPAGKVLAEHWEVHGSGHAWSGGHAPGSYVDSRGPSASEEMLRFFLAHGQPAPKLNGAG